MHPSTPRAGGLARLLSLVMAGSLVLTACGSGAGAASPANASATPKATATRKKIRIGIHALTIAGSPGNKS